MFIVSAYNERNSEKFKVKLATWYECHEWTREIKKQYPLIKSFKIFDNFEKYQGKNWRAYIVA